MLYDTASGPPRPGSLLESVFLLLAKRRQEAEYYQTKAMVLASIVDKIEGGGKLLNEALDNYRAVVFPFLVKEKSKADFDAKKALEHWSSKAFRVKPLWRANENKGVVSRLRKGAERVRELEGARRKHRHTRL